MRSLFFITTLSSLATGFGLPNFPVKGHEWIPAGPKDSRSPCPGLNVLANHGYLPRSGKNIDLPTLHSAFVDAYNYAPDTFDDVFGLVQTFKLTTTGNISTFNLADLAKHDYIEFDGSLSRNDFYFGDNLHFDPKIWATMSQRMALNEVTRDPMSKYVTVESAAKARAARVADAMKINPTFNASSTEMMGSPGTMALWLTTLWDDSVGAAPKEWVKSFFEWERLPYTKPKRQKTGEDIGNMLAKVQAVQV
ncbi:putative sterigmatocystin biosynthesis peroxidase stcC [Trichoderma asperellum]|uniref:Putative sterigmatocystin biosynthesis peroxidase stcC n=1 Tax=Trichoderma asperellum TaxID=101201 RepID=A0A6V8R3N2_TRIAP|nr:putative sterigmatocystin biosynthesis peroxidase stcC [Trichoderma asperellum]